MIRNSRSFLQVIEDKLRQYMAQPSAYRVCVLYGTAKSYKSTVAVRLSQDLEGKYKDLLKEELTQLSPHIGLYHPVDFKKDMTKWAKASSSLLILDEIEPLLDTWAREEQKDLFKLLSRCRTDSVVLLVTRLDLPYEEFLGQERVFRLDQLREGDHVE